MSYDYDVCIIGSGAGGGPIAYTLSQAGYSVCVLEKGPWYSEKDFSKDEIACCIRDIYTPNLEDEKHVIEDLNGEGKWEGESTEATGDSFWNGNCVGGASNFMSGFFNRLKPNDFKLLSTYGPIEGANIVDWPISYEELEPYYTKVESIVGVSGKIIDHPFLEPRSTKQFPYPPTLEHPAASWFDAVCKEKGLHSLVTPRAILPSAVGERGGCSYSGYCGNYGCATKAKGSSRAALLDPAVKSGRCRIIPHSKVYKLLTDEKDRVTSARYFDKKGRELRIRAKIFVVACQAIESARLLLSSVGGKHPKGLGNRYDQVGKNLIFSGGGTGGGDFFYKDLSERKRKELKVQGPFFNRCLQDWYEIREPSLGNSMKGGTVDFLFENVSPIIKARGEKWDERGNLVWGTKFKERLQRTFSESRRLRFEIFCDWLPTDNCFVSLDPHVKDKWGSPVAKVRVGYHPHDLIVSDYIAEKSEELLKAMGAKNSYSYSSGSPYSNLVVGGCRFGDDPKKSVLDRNCKVHDISNLYVTDGSFMPTGGSVTYTWTIYANAFRVADHLHSQL